MYNLCEMLYRSQPVEFSLTDDQRTRLGQHLQTAYPALISQLGSNFHSVVLRMAVHIERMAMILTALRKGSELSLREANEGGEFDSPRKEERTWMCKDADYQMAEMIGNKLILHMAAAYRMIKGKEEVAVPKVEVLDQRKMLLGLLPEEFETKTLVDEAKAQGIPRRTIFRWADEWQQTGIVEKVSHGLYKKQLASA